MSRRKTGINRERALSSKAMLRTEKLVLLAIGVFALTRLIRFIFSTLSLASFSGAVQHVSQARSRRVLSPHVGVPSVG